MNVSHFSLPSFVSAVKFAIDDNEQNDATEENDNHDSGNGSWIGIFWSCWAGLIDWSRIQGYGNVTVWS